MFTGIIEELGTVKALLLNRDGGRITIAAKNVISDIKIGDSLAVEGICLTIIKIGHTELDADISAETLRRSTLSLKKAGDTVNLERALTPSSRMGGHIVQGHIDGMGYFQRKSQVGAGYRMFFSAQADISKFVVEKGSIAINGVSLTVSDMRNDSFSVDVIPHTLEHTTLYILRQGDLVNIEADIIGKYIYRFMQKQDNTESSDSLIRKLRSSGFL